MLPEPLSQLLTAYIDGELGSRQKRAVQRLLRKSPQARAVLHQLQEDSRALRSLPMSRLDQDMSSMVLRTITERRLAVARRATLSHRPQFSAWAGYAAAAAVLLTVFSGSYLYFYASHHGTQVGSGHVATNQPKVKDPVAPSPVVPEKRPPQVVVTPETLVHGPETPAPEKPQPEKKPEPAPKPPSPIQVVVKPEKTTPESPKPTPEAPKPEKTFTIPVPKFEPFTEVNVRDTLSLGMWELDKEKVRKQLHDVLEKDSAHRVEVLFKGSSKGFERLEAAFKAQGVRLLVDQQAQSRMKNRYPTNYVLYVENLTPEEVTRVFETVGLEDKKAESQHRGDGQFGQAFILALSQDDHKELSNLLGVNPVKLDPPQKGPLGVDIRKPISTTTAKELAQAPPRPEAGKPAVVVPLTRQAIVLSYNPVRAPKDSKEIRQFLDSRQPKKPGTLQILLVLRATKG